MNITDFKKYHESLMQNNHGSTVVHTFLYIYFVLQCSILSSITGKRSGPYQCLYEYIVIVLPMILANTILSEYIYSLNFLIFSVLFYQVLKNYPDIDFHESFMELNSYTARLSSISVLRGLTYLITVFCILAVDFKDFPRYLAKTETYGYSLMDTGVGLFVIMSGLVHRDVNKQNFKSVLIGNIRFIIILLGLGITRFASVKLFDYQEHVSEYGVHWNFFFTLAVCKLTSFLALTCSKNTLMLSISILLLHELLLIVHLENWVFSNNPRTTLIEANREGLSSCFGYTSLYIFAAYVKKELCDHSKYRHQILVRLLVGSCFLLTLSYFVNYVRPTSRTLCNSGYCLYLAAFTIMGFTILYLFEALFQNDKLNFNVPHILMAINNNGLIFFLTANILTGIINLSITTFLVRTSVMFVIFNVYMTLTLGLVLCLHKYNIKL